MVIDSSSGFLICLCFLSCYLVFFQYTSRYFTYFFSSLIHYLFYFLRFLLVFFCFNFMIISSNSFLFLFFIESSIAPMFYLMLNFSKDYDKIFSRILIIFFNVAGSLPFIFFCMYLSNNLFISYGFWFFSRISRVFIFFCCCLILIMKLPLFLFHFWLTKAHVRAFGVCSIILASLILKMGSFGFVKFFPVFNISYRLLFCFFVSFCLLSLYFFLFIIIRFYDIKFIVACSSVLHISLIFPMCIHFTRLGWLGSMLMIVGHGVVSYILFFLIRLVYEFRINRSFDFNKSLSSLSLFLGLLFFIFILLNLGLPPFINFLREIFFCLCIFRFSIFCLLFLGVFIIFFIILNIFLICKIFFFKNNYYFYFMGLKEFFCRIYFFVCFTLLVLLLCSFSLI